MWSISDRVQEITGLRRRLTDREIRDLLAEMYAVYPELKRKRVAMEIAFGRMTLRQIAAENHISTRQILRWKEDPDFIQHINNIRFVHNVQLGLEPMVKKYIDQGAG